MNNAKLKLSDVDDDALLVEAHTATRGTITKLLLTLIVFSGFCLLTLASPDALLLPSATSEAFVELPFADLKVSFVIFLIFGPGLLIAVRMYLFFHIEHLRKLQHEMEKRSLNPRPTLSHFEHQILRFIVFLVLYVLVPFTFVFFLWKASPLHEFRVWLLPVTLAVFFAHLLLLLRRSPWSEVRIDVPVYVLTALIFVAAWRVTFVNPQWISRQLDLSHANLSGRLLQDVDFHHAIMKNANLRGALLQASNLSGADLYQANLVSANLRGAILSRARLNQANFDKATLLEVPTLTCDELRVAQNWEKAYRDPILECGEQIPTRPPD